MTFLYLSEAHAEDEWKIGNAHRTDVDSPLWTPALMQSRTVGERLKRAQELAKRFAFPEWIHLAADVPKENSVSGEFETLYGAWPTGFYVVARNTLVYSSIPKLGIFEADPLMSAISHVL